MKNVTTEKQLKDAWTWLFGAGLFAIGVACFAFWCDRTLSTSTHEHDLGVTLREIRQASASVGTSGDVDTRQLGNYVAENRLQELAK